MKLVTAAEMQSIDQAAIHRYGIPGIILMENAGLKVYAKILELYEKIANKNIYIFAGKGNNGGDSFVIARHLVNSGAKVKVFICAKLESVKGDAAVNLEILLHMGVEIIEDAQEKPKMLELVLHKADLIVDAILGTGFKGELNEDIGRVIKSINDSGIPVIAVDIPSGLNADSGKVGMHCVRASWTVTFALPKRGLFLYPGTEYCGEISIVDIGIPRDLLINNAIHGNLVTQHWVAQRFKKRSPLGHKGSYGSVLIMAGSVGMTGAAALTSEAALRAGSGMVTLGIPQSLNEIMEAKLTEVMTVPLPETAERTFSSDALDNVLGILEGKQVLAIGPGLSTHHDTALLLEMLFAEVSIPMVIDADALNIIAQNLEIIRKRRGQVVLTPHPGEMARLLRVHKKEILDDPIGSTVRLAKELEAIVILKGNHTIIADGTGRIFLNTTGNPGMATAGSGDVLTGIIAGFIAQGMIPRDAAVAAVFIHGLAGDIGVKSLGQHSFIAGDLIKYLPHAITSLTKGDDKDYVGKGYYEY